MHTQNKKKYLRSSLAAAFKWAVANTANSCARSGDMDKSVSKKSLQKKTSNFQTIH